MPVRLKTNISGKVDPISGKVGQGHGAAALGTFDSDEAESGGGELKEDLFGEGKKCK